MTRAGSRPSQSLALRGGRCYVRAWMSLRARSLAIVLLTSVGPGVGLAGTGCASRETAASRAAWNKAVRGDGPAPGRGDGRGEDKKAGEMADPSAWRDLASFAGDAAELLSLGVSTVPLATLIARLCAEPPEESPGVLEPDAVRCPPKPTLEPIGHTLTLELSRHGTVGLVATDLSGKESTDLLTLSLKYLAGSCAGGWTKKPGDSTKEFHTCTAPAGSELVLGRFLPDGEGDRWQFSLAVLGPG